jgi:hypothetical protein
LYLVARFVFANCLWASPMFSSEGSAKSLVSITFLNMLSFS